MALPDIAGYLSSTRQPIDYAGPAIRAFQAVSSEMRATRAQNLAEEESARDLGKGIKEGMQNDRMFEEKLIDMHQMREIRAEDQDFERQRLGFEAMRMGMDMEAHRFEMQNLMPLEVQSRQLDMARKEQLYQAAAGEMQTEQYLRDVVSRNLGGINAVAFGELPVPAAAIDTDAGETAESPEARVRAVSSQLQSVAPMVAASRDKGLQVQFQNQIRVLEADPTYQDLQRRDRLMLPSDRQDRNNRRMTTFQASLPFDDAGSASFIERNFRSVQSMLDMPDAEYDAISKRLLSRADAEWKTQQDVSAPSMGQGAINALAGARADLAASQAELGAAEKSGQGKFYVGPLRAKVAAAEARVQALSSAYGLSPSPPTPGGSPGGTSPASFFDGLNIE